MPGAGATIQPSGRCAANVIDGGVTGERKDASAYQLNAPSANADTVAAAGQKRRGRAGAALEGDGAAGSRSAIHDNSSARSCALCQRRSGSFLRHFSTTRSSACDADVSTFETGAGEA